MAPTLHPYLTSSLFIRHQDIFVPLQTYFQPVKSFCEDPYGGKKYGTRWYSHFETCSQLQDPGADIGRDHDLVTKLKQEVKRLSDIPGIGFDVEKLQDPIAVVVTRAVIPQG